MIEQEILYCCIGSHYWAWAAREEQKLKRYSVKDMSDFTGKQMADIVCPSHYDFDESNGLYISRSFDVTIPKGLHARPSAEIVIFASRFKGIMMVAKGRTFKANNVMSIMELEAYQGTRFQMLFPNSIERGLLEEICLGIYHAATTELN